VRGCDSVRAITGPCSRRFLLISLAAVFVIALLVSFARPASTQVNGIRLTGTWTAGNLGVFFIRQIGDEVWWLGEDDPLQPTWCNVGYGKVVDRTITADWIDIPKGSSRSKGTVVLKITYPNRLEVESQTGGFAVKEMTKAKQGVEEE